MFRNPHNLRGSSAHAVNPAPRWRMVFIALVLALSIGSAGQTPEALAAPAADESIWFGLTVEQVGVEHTICVGDDVKIRVEVLRRVGEEGNFSLESGIGNYELIGGPGAIVKASADGRGSVSPPSNTTDERNVPPGAVYFTFHAEDVGLAVVYFEATINMKKLLGFTSYSAAGSTVKNKVIFQVEDCKYRVSVTTTWRLPGEANLVFAAQINFAGMVQDAEDHYTGTAQVDWRILSGQVGDCSGTETGYSQADANGQLVDPDKIIVDVAYQVATYAGMVNCGAAGGNMDLKMTPAAITSTFPAAGGAKTLRTVLHGPEAGGTATFIVTRTTGQ